MRLIGGMVLMTNVFVDILCYLNACIFLFCNNGKQMLFYKSINCITAYLAKL